MRHVPSVVQSGMIVNNSTAGHGLAGSVDAGDGDVQGADLQVQSQEAGGGGAPRDDRGNQAGA